MAAAQQVAPMAPTQEELQSAWHAMRQRRSLCHWPATFEEAMADQLRAKCIAIEAQAATRQRQRRQKQQQRLPVYIGFDLASGPDQTTTHHWRPPQHKSAPAQDLKRAAAGDRDD